LRLHPVRLFDHRYALGLQGGATSHQTMKCLLAVIRCRAITPDDALKVEANINSLCMIPDYRPRSGISNPGSGAPPGHFSQKTKAFFRLIVGLQQQNIVHRVPPVSRLDQKPDNWLSRLTR